jgi:uncharacterized protein (TIGR02246 family)
MKKLAILHVLVGLTLMFYVAAAPCLAQPSESPQVTEIKKVLENHQEAFQKRDMSGTMSFFAQGPDTVLMGTGSGEIYKGKDAIEKAYQEFFKTFDTEKHKFTWMQVKVKDNVAWVMFTSQITSTLKNVSNQFDLHWSGVLEKQNGKWQFVAVHFSQLTDPACHPTGTEPEKKQ